MGQNIIRVNELRHQILISVQVINFGTPLFHGAEVNISIEIGAENRLPLALGCEITCQKFGDSFFDGIRPMRSWT